MKKLSRRMFIKAGLAFSALAGTAAALGSSLMSCADGGPDDSGNTCAYGYGIIMGTRWEYGFGMSYGFESGCGYGYPLLNSGYGGDFGPYGYFCGYGYHYRQGWGVLKQPYARTGYGTVCS